MIILNVYFDHISSSFIIKPIRLTDIATSFIHSNDSYFFWFLFIHNNYFYLLSLSLDRSFFKISNEKGKIGTKLLR